jgi:colicin import membrane protein
VRPPAVPAEAVSKARLGPADGGAATRKRAPFSPLSPSPSSSMDISDDEGVQPLSQEPPPPAPVAHSLQGTQPAVVASPGQSPSMRVYQRAHAVPPGAPPQLEQQQQQEREQQQGKQQQGQQQQGQQQQKQRPQAKPRQQAAKQQPQLVGSPNAQVAAAVAAAQSLTALLDPDPAPLRRTARTQQVASQPASTPAAAVVKQQQQQSAAPAAAAQGASLRPAAAAGQAKQSNPSAGYVQARAEELPPWLALAVSVRARQRAAAEAAAAAAAPTATAAPGVASLSKLRQWQQTAQAHADSASGTPPPTLPFAVAAGASVWSPAAGLPLLRAY